MKASKFDENFHKIINEISDELNIQYTTFFENRLIRLSSQNQNRHIVSYDFDLNNATAMMSARYKDITSSLLIADNLPCVEHRAFCNPKVFKSIDNKGIWNEMITFAQQYNYKIVCKPSNSSFGKGVSFIKNQDELEEITTDLFSSHSVLTLSPYYEIKNEIRFIILCNKCILIYIKKRPSIVGNGIDSVLTLLLKHFEKYQTISDLIASIKEFDLLHKIDINLDTVLAENQILNLKWKHNMSKFSSYEIINESASLSLALSAFKSLNLDFASVDIIETDLGNLVLEVNSGVCLKKLYNKDYQIVKDVYTKAIEKMFKE